MRTAIAQSEKKFFSLHAALFGNLAGGQRSRCAVIVAHPNDEIVGGGFLLSKLADVSILHLSNGVPHSRAETEAAGFEDVKEYAERRRQECFAALAIAGIPKEKISELDLRQLDPPFRLVDLTKEVMRFLQQTSPQVILTHAYEGGHPDHDAAAFATNVAVRLLTENGIKAPTVFEMALYPGKKGLSKVPEFLHNPSRESTTLTLSRDAQDLKLKMFSCFKTHQQIFDLSPLGPERFRQAPDYDFTSPPQAGKLYYEDFDWGMTGEDWRALAREALEKLFPPQYGQVGSLRLKNRSGPATGPLH